MRGEWREVTLTQLGRIVTGKTPLSRYPEYFGGDIPFVTPTDFDGRRRIESTQRCLTEQGAIAVHNARLPSEAIMVSCIGSDMGKSAIAANRCVTNQQINSIIVDSDNDPLFVYYNLSNRKEEIRASAAGSAQPILNKSAFGQIGMLLPPLPEQRAIAHILGTLDDKIELDRRMNETLEEMARALFKSWFVDFDPVRAKMEGRWRPGESLPGLPSEHYDLFPDQLVDSELGEIPEGWEVRTLDSIATFLNGLALQKYPANAGTTLPAIKIAQLRVGHVDGADRVSSEIPDAYQVRDGDVLFSWSGSLEVVIWTGGYGALNQHLFKVQSIAYPKWFYYHWVVQHLPSFRTIAADRATTMGHIRRAHLTEAKVLVPPRHLLAYGDQLLSPLLDKCLEARLESRALAVVRDTLLPKLMSGELRVRENNEQKGI